MDCDPGTSRRKLPYGGTVPISRTSGTIAPDVVQNILRKPYREKFSILLSELGAGFVEKFVPHPEAECNVEGRGNPVERPGLMSVPTGQLVDLAPQFERIAEIRVLEHHSKVVARSERGKEVALRVRNDGGATEQRLGFDDTAEALERRALGDDCLEQDRRRRDGGAAGPSGERRRVAR